MVDIHKTTQGILWLLYGAVSGATSGFRAEGASKNTQFGYPLSTEKSTDPRIVFLLDLSLKGVQSGKQKNLVQKLFWLCTRAFLKTKLTSKKNAIFVRNFPTTIWPPYNSCIGILKTVRVKSRNSIRFEIKKYKIHQNVTSSPRYHT